MQQQNILFITLEVWYLEKIIDVMTLATTVGSPTKLTSALAES